MGTLGTRWLFIFPERVKKGMDIILHARTYVPTPCSAAENIDDEDYYSQVQSRDFQCSIKDILGLIK